jgi:hypothetical protein
VRSKIATPQQLAIREQAIDEDEYAEQLRKEAAAAAAAAEPSKKKGPAPAGPAPYARTAPVRDVSLPRQPLTCLDFSPPHRPPLACRVDATGKKLSRKERRRKGRMEIAQLKQIVANPDVVEMHDTNSPDPQLLVYLKGYRNGVPVPKHWAMKRKYLQGKRGIEKPPFQLPQYIADTGITDVRGAMQDKDAAKGAKQKARDKMQVKMGRMDIDYQVLHDAFFRHQTKPPLTGHGNLYYEGKELEVCAPHAPALSTLCTWRCCRWH